MVIKNPYFFAICMSGNYHFYEFAKGKLGNNFE